MSAQIEAPETEAQTVVEIKDLSHRYGEGPLVLDNLNLEVKQGEFISLLGPSGCGKSTLLKTLCGLTTNESGRILLHGHNPDQARGDCFFVFQDPNLLPWLRVQANTELPLRIKGVPKERRQEKCDALLELVGLGHAKQQFPRQLSGGMGMRVSLARALSVSPSILLLDEPFGALDEMTRNRLNEDLLSIREEDPFTAFYVTHSVAEAVFLSNRIVVLSTNPGRIEEIIAIPFGYPRTADLRESPEYLELLATTSHALRSVNRT